jgi:hypothetical protein
MSDHISLTSEQESEVREGVKDFAEQIAKAQDAHVILELQNPNARLQYESILGRLAEDQLSGALETLASLDDTNTETLHAAGRRRLGSYIITAFQKRICGDPALTEKLRKALADAEKAGHKITTPTAASITVGISTVVTVLVANLFAGSIAVALAPLAGGVTLLLMQVGVDGFCAWSEDAAKQNGGDK